MRLPILILSAALAQATLAHRHAEHSHTLPFVPSADSVQQGFVRIINRSGIAGTVRIHAIDDTGDRFGPVELDIGPDQTRHFNSGNLERGAPSKGLSRGVGDGEGHWWLDLRTRLEIRTLAYIRTPDGFVTSIHDVVREDEGSYHVPFFNPASNQNQRSVLRLVNTSSEDNDFISIIGRDDDGRPGHQAFTFWLPAGESRMVDAVQLEAKFGDGTGKWHLTVESSFWFSRSEPLWVMNLLQTPTGHLTNLSTEREGSAGTVTPPSGTVPPTPDLRVVNDFFGYNIHLAWWPYPFDYDDHALTDIFRGTSDDFSAATKIATTTEEVWGEPYPPGPYPKTVWYWIRWENRSGMRGPPSDAERVLLLRP